MKTDIVEVRQSVKIMVKAALTGIKEPDVPNGCLQAFADIIEWGLDALELLEEGTCEES